MDAIDCLMGCFEENSRERFYTIKLGRLDKGKKQREKKIDQGAARGSGKYMLVIYYVSTLPYA